VESVFRAFLVGVKDVPVDVEGGRGMGVAQEVADDLQVGSIVQHGGGEEVTELVRGDAGDPGGDAEGV